MEWQPIETGPTDRSELILANRIGKVGQGVLFLDYGGKLVALFNTPDSWGDFICRHPTHWMPLPTAPTS